MRDVSAVLQVVDFAAYEELLLQMRRWLHMHPETAMQEKNTSRYIAEQLQSFGLQPRLLGETGVVAEIRAGSADGAFAGTSVGSADGACAGASAGSADGAFAGTLAGSSGGAFAGASADSADGALAEIPVLAVRAEIDALSITEATGLPFASQEPGRMHACGHDANTAVILALAAVLAGNRALLRCHVRLLFEPAEETGEGARYMMAHGALTNPVPSGILIFHFGNQERRSMEIQKSISTAAIGGLRVTVKGKESHFSQYREGVDALYAASRFAVAAREINDMFPAKHPFVLAFGTMQAGPGRNTVSSEAVLEGSLRAFSEEDFSALLGELQTRAEDIASETKAAIRVELTKKLPPIVNAPQLVETGMRIGRALFGEACFAGEQPFLVGDNAAYYMEEIPGMRVVFLAGKEGEQAYPVHNPKFDLDEAVMMDAVKFLFAFCCCPEPDEFL